MKRNSDASVIRVSPSQRSWVTCGTVALILAVPIAAAAQDQDWKDEPPATPLSETVFRLGEIVNVGAPAVDVPGVVGGSILRREQTWTFERPSLDQAVNMIPGVSSTIETNGRRNEANVFVRGFDRWQVPLMVDGVRIYLPADN